MKSIVVTKHAEQRAKKRLNWKRTVLQKMANRAYNNGISHSETTGALKRYISKLWHEKKSVNNTRIYGDNIYLFCGKTLVTLYRLDDYLLKGVEK